MTLAHSKSQSNTGQIAYTSAQAPAAPKDPPCAISMNYGQAKSASATFTASTTTCRMQKN
jgi:hypothetical protein